MIFWATRVKAFFCLDGGGGVVHLDPQGSSGSWSWGVEGFRVLGFRDVLQTGAVCWGFDWHSWSSRGDVLALKRPGTHACSTGGSQLI